MEMPKRASEIGWVDGELTSGLVAAPNESCAHVMLAGGTVRETAANDPVLSGSRQAVEWQRWAAHGEQGAESRRARS